MGVASRPRAGLLLWSFFGEGFFGAVEVFVVAAGLNLIRFLRLFPLDGVVDLSTMDRDVLGRGDSQPHLVTPHIDDGDLDLIADHDGFVFLSAQNQHR